MNQESLLRFKTKQEKSSEIKRRRRFQVHKVNAHKNDTLLARAFVAEVRNEKWVTDCVR